MKSVLIVEDHDDTRAWWLEHISEAFPEAQALGAVTLKEARKHLKSNSYCLALVDINLPDGSGIDLVREIAVSHPRTYTVITTIFDDDTHIFSALQAGAKGYLIKEQLLCEQVDQLKAVLQGQPPLSPGIARRILAYFSRLGQKAEETEALTTRENEVLQLIAKGFSRPEVARLLGLTTNTVAGYTKIIYQKLNVSSRAEAVYEGLRLGLIDPF
ncbi:response regulator [Geopsychrobacter electrodiphilus]|uniref:response regulator n=1 Tax=Geopsychrobacter electrodiphilus TaxID=225196 RepID=UPI00035E9BF0|nr:response regulator transcription factor [Geopsychrobacter electrodiphilus]